MPYHLLLPLMASMLFALGLVLTKRSQSYGVSTWMIVFTANVWAAIFFSTLWVTESKPIPWNLIWQPALVGLMYIMGQSFTFLALDRGDVSVAAPILSSKVVIVAVLVTVLAGDALSATGWVAVMISMAGIILAQRSDATGKRHHRLLWSVAFALSAAMTFSLFDISVQQWASKWGAGHFLPIVFWTGALLSVGYLPLIDHSKWNLPGAKGPLLLGTACIGLQAICIVCTLAYFGDAAKVNIVYALRALWGVVFAWLLAERLQMGEQHVSRRTMQTRLAGALLLTLAVIMILLDSDKRT